MLLRKALGSVCWEGMDMAHTAPLHLSTLWEQCLAGSATHCPHGTTVPTRYFLQSGGLWAQQRGGPGVPCHGLGLPSPVYVPEAGAAMSPPPTPLLFRGAAADSKQKCCLDQRS